MAEVTGQSETQTGGRRRLLLAGAGLAGVLIVLAIAVPLAGTASPSFFSRYSGLKPRYDTWHRSKHKNVACFECHSGSQSATGYRLSLVREYYRGLFGGSSKKPVMVRLERPTRQACLKCHADAWNIDSRRLLQVPHPAHIRVAQEKRDCVTCHKWTTHVEQYAIKHKKMPFTGICTSYGCHSGSKPLSECRYCHHAQSFPAAAWRKFHPQVVLAKGSADCTDYCHDTRQCRTCHQTGKAPDMGVTAVASNVRSIASLHAAGNWLAQHGKQAQINVSRCYYCHGSGAECKECHSRRPAFHGPKASWLGRHQKPGKNKARCLACHVERDCTDCHNIFKEG